METEASMQLVDTHVGNATEGMITVEFRGEGGELISVKMASDEGLRGVAAVTRAKALMVQLATFADDSHTSSDAREHSQEDAADSEERGSAPAEAKSGLPVVSTLGDAPSSAA
jgi:hypothetical protein